MCIDARPLPRIATEPGAADLVLGLGPAIVCAAKAFTGIPDADMQRLSKRFGDHWALQELDLRVGAGEIQCLLGAIGAGHSTPAAVIECVR